MKNFYRQFFVLLFMLFIGFYSYAESAIIYNEKETVVPDVSNAQVKLTAQMNGLDVGDIVYFGHYEQDNILENGKEPIAWEILAIDQKNKVAELISVYVLDCLRFNGFSANVTWDNSSLRAYMRDTMINDMFTEEEKKCLRHNHVINHPNLYNGTYSGENTDDYIYIPSILDMFLYFSYDELEGGEKLMELLKPNSRRVAEATKYAIARGVRVSSNKKKVLNRANYFLRTAGRHENRIWYNDVYNEFYQSFVNELGEVKPDGTGINSCDDGIRVMTQVFF